MSGNGQRARALVAALAIASTSGCVGKSRRRADGNSEETRSETVAEAAAEPLIDSTPVTGIADWLAIGGGGLPVDYQVSIEQDLALAQVTFKGPGWVLLGAGRGSRIVQVQDPSLKPDLGTRLGEIFAPRFRGTRYRAPDVTDARRATRESVLEALSLGASTGTGPFLIYFAGHGGEGPSPAETTWALWEQTVLTPRDLADALDEATVDRPVQVVATSCFGGGFAELAFAGGDAAKGAATKDRCGLFATTWDLPAAGCDPDPDRRKQEGYGIHFLHALSGQDRHGVALTKGQVDVDGDGRVSLLEAHTWARIASRSANIPTTTSERWLRQTAPKGGAMASVQLPEDEAVTAALAERLTFSLNQDDLAASLAAIDVALDPLDARFQQMSEELRGAEDAEARAYRRIVGDLLARWPYLDDPWHPRYRDELSANEQAIANYLDTSASYEAYQVARAEFDDIDGAIWELRRHAASWQNLYRAIETRLLASRLKAAGGEAWRRYSRFLSCERSSSPALPGR